MSQTPFPADSALAGVLQRAMSAHQSGNLPEAERLYRDVLGRDKHNFDALHMLGVLEAQRGNFKESEQWLRKAIAIDANFPMCVYNYGKALSMLGRHAEAVAAYDRLLKIAPDFVPAYSDRGNSLQELKRYAEALASYDKALSYGRSFPEAHYNRGNALMRLKRYAEARESFDRAIAANPAYAKAHCNRGDALYALGQLADALASYDRALAVDARLAEAWSGRGGALATLGRAEEALAAFERALALNANLAPAWAGRAVTLFKTRHFADAVAAFDRALAIKTDLDYAAGYRLLAKMHVCDWSEFDAECRRLVTAVKNGGLIDPFTLLAIPASPTVQLQCAKAMVADRYPSAPPPARVAPLARERIRVAYLSADFHVHPVAMQIAEVFERHDRARFETVAVSFGPDDGSELRRRLRQSFERFVDVQGQGDAAIVDLVRRMDVDIAVDLNGITENARTAVLAQRVAPVQVNWLGYAATMGAPFMDYILADRFVIPADHKNFYAEKVVWLPDSYMPNDSTRRIADATPTRAAAGLPAAGFVFCCFNNSYKMTPALFDVWMRLLRAVEGSVLWLREVNPAAPVNLRREAQMRGVSPERIVFAPRVDLADHLARHRLADLFLDTMPYNAHATAADALWTGLPVVTCAGSTFAGRVSEGLLAAAGLPELVARSLADYEALALKLAREPALLASLKAKLAANRDTCPLFDTQRFTRHLEAAFAGMWERHKGGKPPESFAVAAGA